MNRKQDHRKRRASNFHAERSQGEVVDLGKLAFLEIAYRPEAGAAQSLRDPSKQGEPGDLAQGQLRRSEPNGRDWKPGNRGGAEIMGELHASIEDAFVPSRVYCTVTVMQACAPIGVWFLLTGLTQTFRLPGFSGPA